MGELGSLKDQLGAARKEAKRMARDQIQSGQPQMSRRVIHDEDLNEHHSTEVSMEGCSVEEVFIDDSILIVKILILEREKNRIYPGLVREIVPGILSQCWCVG